MQQSITDQGHLERFSKLITNYKENVNDGSLLIVELASFYISALLGDMQPFEEAKKMFVEKAKGRKNKHVRFYGDGTGFLFKNNHFDECTIVEEWWQQNPFDGSYLCSFPKQQFFSALPHQLYAKRSVVDTHDIVIDIVNAFGNKNRDERKIKDDQLAKQGEHRQQQQEELPSISPSPLTMQAHNSDKLNSLDDKESDKGGN